MFILFISLIQRYFFSESNSVSKDNENNITLFKIYYKLPVLRSKCRSENLNHFLKYNGCSHFQKRKRLISIFTRLTTSLLTDESYDNIDLLYIGNYCIDVSEGCEFCLRDYLFDFRGIIDAFDSDNMFVKRCWYNLVSNTDFGDFFTKKFLDYLHEDTFLNDINENYDMENLPLIFQKLSEKFVFQFWHNEINSRKTLYSENRYFLSKLIGSKKIVLEDCNLKFVLKYLWKCFINDPGYEIIKILFPELIYIIKNSLKKLVTSESKRFHALLGFIIFRVQFNLPRIKLELENLIKRNDDSITKSHFINRFIYKTRLYISIVLNTLPLDNDIKNHILFLAFLSFIRVYYPSFSEILVCDEYFCSNLLFDYTLKFYSEKFYDINVELNTFFVRLEIKKLEIKDMFLYMKNEECYFDQIDFNIFLHKFTEIMVSFENVEVFKKKLHEETLASLNNFLKEF